jgi:hypothetical protein
MDSCSSCSVVNFINGCSLLNSLRVCCKFVLFWSYIIDISKVFDYLFFVRMGGGGYICLCSMCCIYVLASIDDVANTSVCL